MKKSEIIKLELLAFIAGLIAFTSTCCIVLGGSFKGVITYIIGYMALYLTINICK